MAIYCEFMLRILLISVIYFLGYSLSAQEDRSFQIWNLNSVQGSLTEKMRIKLSEKIHYTPGESNLDIKSADFSITYRPKKRFDFGTGFRISGIEQETGWLREQRFVVFGNLFNESEKLEYSFVNRIDYRTFNNADNHFRHKQSFTLFFPIMTSWAFRFYSTEETFVKFNSENFHLARLYGGLQNEGLKHFTMKLYYVLEKYQRPDSWKTRDILGINLSFYL